ncbi:MAG: 2-succinyl-5-enolpyruvyl-6-hydroxy-3-cyclohexene-1-carboxylic-acid synthase [Actinobacteria bacterium]|nr:2-succinyl-5-enolpyruvyl-6-hydroxy-3-cyclohexene-1-carboxylic-acid synthase [Actinomycetota bacterium]
MEEQKNNLNTFWGKLIIEELVRNGIDYFCISPGSRSTPLTASAALNPKAKIIMIYDERSSGYHALGYAKYKSIPAVVITTSGTAVANLYPSVIEAGNSNIPIIILTADRPPELQEVNANQTIDQDKIFGKYTKWFFNLPCPDLNIKPEFILDTINYAIYQSLKNPQGPVHINCQFRKPLEPGKINIDHDYTKNIKRWQLSNSPYTCFSSNISLGEDFYNDNFITKSLEIINSANKGLISIGALDSTKQAESVLKVVQKLNWPVYADITSHLRLTRCGSNMIRHFDQEILSERFNQKAAPDTVLHFGSRITSKRFGQFMDQNRPRNFIVVNENNKRGDPSEGITSYIYSDIALFCEIILRNIEGLKSNDFKEFYDLKNGKIQTIIEKNASESEKISEVFIARYISKKIPDNTSLFLSSSMPIRDMDLYGVSGRKNITVGANRGASGIDGILSTATGYAHGGNYPCTVLIGDQAFIHDLNSLSLFRSLEVPVIVILINNHGGGIFHFLPISNYMEIFEKYFVVPHDFSFKGVCSSFGLEYYFSQDKASFMAYYDKLLEIGKSGVLEVNTDRHYNIWLRKKIKVEILSILEK